MPSTTSTFDPSRSDRRIVSNAESDQTKSSLRLQSHPDLHGESYPGPRPPNKSFRRSHPRPMFSRQNTNTETETIDFSNDYLSTLDLLLTWPLAKSPPRASHRDFTERLYSAIVSESSLYALSSRTLWNDKEWFLLGSGDQTDTHTRASATSVTVNADVSTTYHVGRRAKAARHGAPHRDLAVRPYSAIASDPACKSYPHF